MATEFAAILLAGGCSSRMGRDKALLDWQGRPLIDHMLGLLRAAGASRIVVSGDRPAHGGIPDAWPGRGPVGGLASVLGDCGDGRVVVVPVDLPRLSASRIASLVAALSDHRAAYYAGHPLPCAFVSDAASRALARELVAAAPGGPSMRAWLQACGAIALEAGEAADLRPCNTPADFLALAP